jgi:hypothetical protein
MILTPFANIRRFPGPLAMLFARTRADFDQFYVMSEKLENGMWRELDLNLKAPSSVASRTRCKRKGATPWVRLRSNMAGLAMRSLWEDETLLRSLESHEDGRPSACGPQRR